MPYAICGYTVRRRAPCDADGADIGADELVALAIRPEPRSETSPVALSPGGKVAMRGPSQGPEGPGNRINVKPFGNDFRTFGWADQRHRVGVDQLTGV